MNHLILALVVALSACPADTNSDGWVDERDLSVLIENWGLVGFPNVQGDVNGDGLRNMEDLMTILSTWGRCNTPEAITQDHIWSMRWEGCTGESIWLSEFISTNYFRYWRLMVKCHNDSAPDTWHYILMHSEIDWVGTRYRWFRPTEEWAYVKPNLVDQWYAVGGRYPVCECKD
jgi:hypothetical protein